jgi:hypothetical protein
MPHRFTSIHQAPAFRKIRRRPEGQCPPGAAIDLTMVPLDRAGLQKLAPSGLDRRDEQGCSQGDHLLDSGRTPTVTETQGVSAYAPS